MTDPLTQFYRHPVVVTRASGSGRYGPTDSTPETIMAFIDDRTQLAPGPAGVEIVASARVAFPTTYAYVPVDSHVTLPAEFGGRTAKVVAADRGDGGGLPTPDHYEIGLG